MNDCTTETTYYYPPLLLKVVSIVAVLFGPGLFGEPSVPENLWHIGRCFAGYHAECSDKPHKKESVKNAE